VSALRFVLAHPLAHFPSFGCEFPGRFPVTPCKIHTEYVACLTGKCRHNGSAG
jgi:hypothetical protein